MIDTFETALTCADAIQHYLIAGIDGEGSTGDIIDIVRGRPLRRTDLRELLRCARDADERLRRLASQQEIEYGVAVEIPEEHTCPQRVIYQCTDFADAQDKAAGSRDRIRAPWPPRIMCRTVTPWQQLRVVR